MLRPRPRPKPRPRLASAAPSSPGPSRTSPLPSTAPTAITVDDEDALFIRKPIADWSRKPRVTEKEQKKTKKKPTNVIISDSSDVEVQDSSPSRPQPKKKKKTEKKGTLRDWTKSANVSFISSDDENDDIIEQRIADTTPSAKRIRREPEKSTNNKRQRSRSPSLTPPPELPKDVYRSAVNRIRDMINIEPRAPSPTFFADESTDTIVLDPELAKIASQINSGKPSSFTPAGSRGATPALEGGPEIVTIRVRWKPHPLNEAARPRQWDFKMKRHDPFKALFEETADEAAVLSDNLIVTHNGTRVFPSASPHGIGVWSEAELEVCDKITYDYLRAHQRRSPSLVPDIPPPSSSLPSSHTLPPMQEESEDEASEAESAASAVEDKGDKFKIILRSSISKNISLTVRPTTKCGAIVKAFLKSAGLADKYPDAGEVGGKSATKKGRRNAAGSSGGPWLMVDGAKMGNDKEIGDEELEDGDMIEVTGL